MHLDTTRLDDSLFIMAAFRYALGRRSYAVSSVATVLISLAPELPGTDRSRIVLDIAEAIANSLAGDPGDVAIWKHVQIAMWTQDRAVEEIDKEGGA